MNFVNGNVQGADVSFYQDAPGTPQQIDFSKMVEQGAQYVIIRAGQNLWTDPDFVYNWRNARVVGLPRGAYWFYDSRVDPRKQAEIFASNIKGDPAELELWIDLEENYGGPYTGYAHWKTFLNKLRELMPGTPVGIYTSYGYITGKIPTSEYAYFSAYPLWLAWYTKNEQGAYCPEPDQVTVPAPWLRCRYWQWGTPLWGLAWGCESVEIDMNLFNGSPEDFRRLYNTGGLMPFDHYYKVSPNIQGEYRSIRAYAYPNINGPKIGQINPYSFAKCRTDDVYVYTSNVMEGTATRALAGDRWLHVFEANGVSIDGWVAEIHLGVRYLAVEEIGAQPTQDKLEIFVNGVKKFEIVGSITLNEPAN